MCSASNLKLVFPAIVAGVRTCSIAYTEHQASYRLLSAHFLWFGWDPELWAVLWRTEKDLVRRVQCTTNTDPFFKPSILKNMPVGSHYGQITTSYDIDNTESCLQYKKNHDNKRKLWTILCFILLFSAGGVLWGHWDRVVEHGWCMSCYDVQHNTDNIQTKQWLQLPTYWLVVTTVVPPNTAPPFTASPPTPPPIFKSQIRFSLVYMTPFTAGFRMPLLFRQS